MYLHVRVVTLVDEELTVRHRPVGAQLLKHVFYLGQVGVAPEVRAGLAGKSKFA